MPTLIGQSKVYHAFKMKTRFPLTENVEPETPKNIFLSVLFFIQIATVAKPTVCSMQKLFTIVKHLTEAF